MTAERLANIVIRTSAATAFGYWQDSLAAGVFLFFAIATINIWFIEA